MPATWSLTGCPARRIFARDCARLGRRAKEDTFHFDPVGVIAAQIDHPIATWQAMDRNLLLTTKGDAAWHFHASEGYRADRDGRSRSKARHGTEHRLDVQERVRHDTSNKKAARKRPGRLLHQLPTPADRRR
ncbi:hypothetical protein [Asaia sp. VD9]|uniref:hypothetical protein n=1 Tax=Asaia sp. VD9 TaxID=3081235 RepID=UPI00301794CF